MRGTRPEPVDDRSASRRRWHALWTFVSLLGVLLLVYSPALNGGLLWDDDVHVTPPELRSVAGLVRILTEPGATQQYYPLLYSAFWLEHRLWGDAPLGYHLTNVALHALSASLLGLLLTRLRVPGASLAAWLFALHPVAVESVAWISEQKNTLSTVFFLAAAVLYLRFDEDRKRLHYSWAVALFLCALASKTATVTLPAVLLVVLWWRRGRIEPQRDLVPLLPWFVLAGVAAAITVRIESRLVMAVAEEWSLSFLDRILLAGRATWFYLGKLVWPAEIVFIYPRWKIDSSAAWQYVFPVAAVGLTVFLWSLRRRSRSPLAAWLVYVGNLAPTLGFFDVYVFRYSFVADHFQYVAAMSLIALAAAGLVRLSSRVPFRAALTAGVLLPAALGVKSWREAFEYRSAEIHYRSILTENPSCFLAYNNLGLLRLDEDRIPEAIELFANGLKHKSDSAELNHNLGNALVRAGRVAEAIPRFESALEVRPAFAEAANNLGNALRALGRNQEAISRFEHAIASRSSFPEAESNLGAALTDAGRPAEAIPHFERALAMRAGFAEAENGLGVALAALGRTQEALARYASALALEPGYVEAEVNTGSLFVALGRSGEAIRHFERALALRPGHPEAENGLGAALATLGRAEEAITHFEAALEARPAYATAERNLGNLLAGLGRLSEALPHLEAAVRLQPENRDALESLAMALSRANRNAEAVQRFEQAVERAPEDPDLRFNLGVALARSGRVRQARVVLEEVLRLRPDHGRAKGLLAALGGRAG